MLEDATLIEWGILDDDGKHVRRITVSPTIPLAKIMFALLTLFIFYRSRPRFYK